MRFEYHDNSLDKIITALGYELKLTMREGRLIQITDGLGGPMQYRYENGLLSDVVHMDQGITHYEYDENGYLTKAADQAGVTYLENEYDSRGWVVLQTLANGDAYEAEYQEEKRQVRVHSSIGNKTVVYRYGKECQVLSMSYGDGTRTSYEYDDNGYRTHEISRLGQKKSWTYDQLGRMVSEQSPGGLVTEYIYNEADDLIEKRDQAGRPSRYEYDALGRCMAREDGCGRMEYGYNAKNFRTMARDGEGNESHYMYDGMGRLLVAYTPKAWKERKGEYIYKFDKLNTAITSFLLTAIVEKCQNIFVLNKFQLLAQFWFDGII